MMMVLAIMIVMILMMIIISRWWRIFSWDGSGFSDNSSTWVRLNVAGIIFIIITIWQLILLGKIQFCLRKYFCALILKENNVLVGLRKLEQARLRDSEGKHLPNGEHPGIHWNRFTIYMVNVARGTTDPEIDSVTWIKFSNNMTLIAFVANLATRWRHLQ